jgi:hypothetical protein
VLKALDVWNLRLRLVAPRTRVELLAAMGMPPKAVPSMDDYVISPWLVRQAAIQLAVCTKQPAGGAARSQSRSDQ